MANPWFRMYHEFATDPKVQCLPEAMQRRLIMLFCLQCNETLDTLKDSDIAFQMRISEEELQNTKMLFIKKGLINQFWAITKWDKRQFVSDSSTERQRKHRAKLKAAEIARKARMKRDSDVTVT